MLDYLFELLLGLISKRGWLVILGVVLALAALVGGIWVVVNLLIEIDESTR